MKEQALLVGRTAPLVEMLRATAETKRTAYPHNITIVELLVSVVDVHFILTFPPFTCVTAVICTAVMVALVLVFDSYCYKCFWHPAG